MFWGVLLWASFTAAPFVIAFYIGPHLSALDQGGSVNASIATFAACLVFVLFAALFAYRKEGLLNTVIFM